MNDSKYINLFNSLLETNHNLFIDKASIWYIQILSLYWACIFKKKFTRYYHYCPLVPCNLVIYIKPTSCMYPRKRYLLACKKFAEISVENSANEIVKSLIFLRGKVTVSKAQLSYLSCYCQTANSWPTDKHMYLQRYCLHACIQAHTTIEKQTFSMSTKFS